MIRIISKDNQAKGNFNNGEILENKPIGFPQEIANIHWLEYLNDLKRSSH